MGITNLGARRSKGYYYFWSLMFVVALSSVIGVVGYAASEVDYNWRWYRVPRYFYYQEQIEVRSELMGDVVALEETKDGTLLTLSDGTVEETHTVPPDGKVMVSKGFFVSPGDILGSYERWRPGLLLEGLWMTLKISFIAIILGIGLGLVTGLARISDNPMFKWAAMTYIELVRGSPLLVQIFIWYFVVGTLVNDILAKQGFWQIPGFWFGVASLATFSGAYIAEIVRAGIQSIHRGQVEAARSLGMSAYQAMLHVILPQALRRILPPLAGQFISLIKDSSLLGIIAIRELTKATREAVASSLQSFELWFLCALLYLILTFTLSMILQWVERRTMNS